MCALMTGGRMWITGSSTYRDVQPEKLIWKITVLPTYRSCFWMREIVLLLMDSLPTTRRLPYNSRLTPQKLRPAPLPEGLKAPALKKFTSRAELYSESIMEF